VIDLHMHTTASDGRSSPEELVAEARAAGCHTIAITDHDTVAGVVAARAAAVRAGVALIDGIEMTAVEEGTDLHILGYFIDPGHAGLAAFLHRQRERRRERVAVMAERLRAAGAPIDVDAILAVSADSGRAVGRPAVARALVAAGHAADVADAFSRFLSKGGAGHVPRAGASAGDVIAQIRGAGGIASIAHPGKSGRDHLIRPMADAGLQAIEVYHSDHSVADVVRYQALADDLGLVITGGSDYHGPGSGRVDGFGRVGLPPRAFADLRACAGR
jgi:predicted metal-dependent phosphoesterase TrpH